MDWILDEPYIEITARCNLQCTHCYNASSIVKKDELNLNQIESCLRFFQSKKIKNISISGGEPLVHHNIVGILKLCNAYEMRVLLATNGILLTEDMINSIQQYVSLYQISIDGDKESHNKIRGERNFEKAQIGIRNLCNAGLNKITRLRMTISSQNYLTINTIINLAIGYGLEAVQFSTVRKQGRAANEFNEVYALSDQIKYDIYNQVEELRRKHKNLLNISRLGFDGGECGLINEPASIKPRIDSIGNIYPCHGFSDSQYCLGSLQSGVENVFSDENITHFLNDIKAARENVLECKRCIWKKSLCKSGCPAQSYYLHGIINDTDGLCNVRRKIWKDRLIHRT